MDAQTIALIAGLIILVASIIGIGGLLMSTVSNKKQVAILICCVFGFLVIQSQAVLITAHYDDIADAKRDVRYAQKRVADAKTALEECQKEHAQQPQHHPDDPCWREQIRLATASSFLSEYEARLKDSKALALSPFIGVPLTGIIGILIVIGSIVLAIIFKPRQTHP